MSETQQSEENQLTNIATNVRHFMWNDDYIELLSHKLGLQAVKSLVDIGSGLGYLAGQFGLYMKPGSTVHGFARDADAVSQARARAAVQPYSVTFQFETADPLHLPLPDASADLVICQHVLAHEADPAGVLAEMVRVTRPGGRVVAFEPNSLVQALTLHSVSQHYDLEERLRLVRYQFSYEAGKRALGDGNDSIGDQVPGLFKDAGLSHIEVRLSDKSAALIPPYDTEEKRARASELLGWLASYQANRDYIRRCFLEGGGTPDEFEAFSSWELAENERIRGRIQDETFVHPGGLLTYIVIGQK